MSDASDNVITRRTRLRDGGDALLNERLRRAERSIRRARSADAPEARDVHRVRVASREAAATLGALASELPAARHKRLQKALKGARRSAGEARMYDALRPLLASRAASATSEIACAAGYLLARVEARNNDARSRLIADLGAIDLGAMKRSRRRLLNATRRSSMPIGDLGERAIARQGARVRDAVEADLHEVENLHALRIACKRMRYTLEAFTGVIEAQRTDEALPALREVQERLGRLNDACDALALVEQELARARETGAPTSIVTGLAWIRAGLLEEQNAQRASFLLWWRGAVKRTMDSIDRLSGGGGTRRADSLIEQGAGAPLSTGGWA